MRPDDLHPRLVVLGAGFGAFSLIRHIDIKRYQCTVVSPRNHFLFTPLLTSTTTGTIEFRSIIEPVRTARPNIGFHLAEATDIHPAEETVQCRSALDGREFTLRYDRLVIAVGARNNTFGIPGVTEHACFLKEASDARRIRQNVLACFEQAATAGVPEAERRRLLHFVVVGGGPTGVEFAAELHDFLADVRTAFPRLLEDVRITLLEATGDILHSFDRRLRDYALHRFRRERIDIRLESPVKRVDEGCLELQNGETLEYGLVVWATGNGPRPFIRDLDFEKNRKDMLVTDEYLQVKGHPPIYALGDCADVEDQHLPATAQVAQRQGKYLARTFNREARGKPVRPFEHHNMGMLAYVGGGRALADLPQVKGSGFGAWFFWRSAYLTKLVSLKNKILVLFDWIKAALFGRDISRF